MLLFIIFGKNMQENRKALKEVVSSGKIGDIGVDKEELKISMSSHVICECFWLYYPLFHFLTKILVLLAISIG